MRSSRIAIVAALATVISALAAQGAAARPFQTGLFDNQTFALNSNLPYTRARDAGARFLRIAISWRAAAPTTSIPVLFDPTDPGADEYDFERIDRQVRRAARAGLVPMLDPVDAPRWAQRCTGDAPICDLDPEQLRLFALALSRRYSGFFDPDGVGSMRTLPEVRYYQALNEPNLHLFFLPQRGNGGAPISPILYRAILNRFSAGIKGGNPDAVVVAAGLAPLGRHPGVAPLEFMRDLLCMGGVRNPREKCDAVVRFDIWATHPYTAGGPTHSAIAGNDVSLGDLAEMSRLLRAADRAGNILSDRNGVPFWVTEFSWDSNPPDPRGLPAKLHARWTAEAFYRMWKAGVSAVFWFLLRDEGEHNNQQPGGGATYESGLFLRGSSLQDDEPKLSYSAYRFPFVALLKQREVTLWGRTPSSAPGGVQIEIKIRGNWRRLATLHANDDGIFEAKVNVPRALRALDLGWRNRPVRARFKQSRSVPFSLHYVHDRYVRPFGS